MYHVCRGYCYGTRAPEVVFKMHFALASQLCELVDTNSRYMTKMIVNNLQISKSSVEDHLHQLDYVSSFDVWLPY